jgi:hypothetical protein
MMKHAIAQHTPIKLRIASFDHPLEEFWFSYVSVVEVGEEVRTAKLRCEKQESRATGKAVQKNEEIDSA